MNIPVISGEDFVPLIPAIILCIGAMLLLLSEVFLSTASRAHQATLALICTAAAGVVAVSYAFGQPHLVFGGMGVQDAFAGALTAVVCAGLFLAILLAAGFLRARNAERGEFYALALFSAAGMSLLAASAELVTLFINLEILSVATYALASYLRRGTRPAEAGFKYFILGAFSAALLLYGTALLYGVTGTTRLYALSDALRAAVADPSQRPLAYCALGLIAAGFAFKVAAVPFHMWAPDVYEGAPTPVTALMSAGVKAAAFAALLRVFVFAGKAVDPKVPLITFGGLAFLTMVGGNLLALPQRNVKRMLAYSSIAHAGYLLLGVCVLFARPSGESGVLQATPLLPGVGVGTLEADALRGILFYLLGYTVSAVGAFGAVAALERREDEERGTAWDLNRFSGLAQRRPLWAVAMAAFMLSLGGIPPTVGFISKLLIFRTAVDAGLLGLTVVAVLSSAAGVYYYLRVVVYMFMRPATEGAPPAERQLATEVALWASTAAVVLLGILPGPVTQWLAQAGLMFGQ
ncbi:MAG: NADH-quinone oxidoreductase subunit N [Myxococcales bacterium]|nr:NADH-quinone oxidoreductase subunit N [Myxococcales bacterium]